MGDVDWTLALSAVATVFSGSAAIAAFWTVGVQRKELALQREELKLTREEMAGQTAQLRESAAAQSKLAEATFDLVGRQREATTAQLLLARATAEGAAHAGTTKAARAVLAELRTRTKDFIHED